MKYGLLLLTLPMVMLLKDCPMTNKRDMIEDPIKVEMNVADTLGGVIQRGKFPRKIFYETKYSALSDDHFLLVFSTGTGGDILLKHPVEVTIGGEDCTFSLPSAHTLFISQRAGHIQSLGFVRFEEPYLALADAAGQAQQLQERFKQAGWSEHVWHGYDRIVKDHRSLEYSKEANPFGKKTIGIWYNDACKQPLRVYLEMKVMDWKPVAIATPPAILSWGSSKDKRPHRPMYYLYMGVYSNLPFKQRPEYSEDFLHPRRVFVNGNCDGELPLSLWLDDPDWTPQKAGMERITDVTSWGGTNRCYWRMPGQKGSPPQCNLQ